MSDSELFEPRRAMIQLSVLETMQRPVAEAYAYLTDHAFHERRAIRSGFEVVRDGPSPEWRISGHLRGKTRHLLMRMTEARPKEAVHFIGASDRIDCQVRIIFLPLGHDATRLRLDAGLSPRTLAGRVILQSMKLGRRRIERRLGELFTGFCRHGETRWEAPRADDVAERA